MTGAIGEPAAALQAQIRRAGATVHVLRIGTYGALLLWYAGAMVFFAVRRSSARSWGWEELINACVLAGLSTLLVACLRERRRDADLLIWPCLYIALGMTIGQDCSLALALLAPLILTALYWPVRGRSLRRALQALPPDQRLAALRPLLNDPCRQTQVLALPLLQECRASGTELVPAAVPEGRGSEAIAAGSPGTAPRSGA
jgi:hypothetical protein